MLIAVFKKVFFNDKSDPLVYASSSLVPTSRNIPIFTLLGTTTDSVSTVIPEASLVVSYLGCRGLKTEPWRSGETV